MNQRIPDFDRRNNASKMNGYARPVAVTHSESDKPFREKETVNQRHKKKIPVIFFDEAHKL